MTTQTPDTSKLNAPDLVKTYPRSPNEHLGFYVLLPRIIDKCRATLAGSNGEYNYNCPLDQRFFGFTGIDAEAFKAEVAKGSDDKALLSWVQQHSNVKNDEQIKAWSYAERWRRPAPEMAHYFESMRLDFAPDNYRIETWFQLLDADEKRF